MHGGQVHTNTRYPLKGDGMKKLLVRMIVTLITGSAMAALFYAGNSKLIEGNVLKIEGEVYAVFVAAGGSAGKTERSERC